MRETQALEQGYTIDHYCNPKVAYKDARYDPDELVYLTPQGNFEDVQDFHAKFGVPVASSPTIPDNETYKFRRKFMQEEIDEFEAAYLDLKVGVITEAQALHEMADALVDLVYVAMGTADMMGLPWQKLWDEVQRANMSKVRATDASQSKRGSALDVVKPEGWVAPNHYPALGL